MSVKLRYICGLPSFGLDVVMYKKRSYCYCVTICYVIVGPEISTKCESFGNVSSSPLADVSSRCLDEGFPVSSEGSQEEK